MIWTRAPLCTGMRCPCAIASHIYTFSRCCCWWVSDLTCNIAVKIIFAVSRPGQQNDTVLQDIPRYSLYTVDHTQVSMGDCANTCFALAECKHNNVYISNLVIEPTISLQSLFRYRVHTVSFFQGPSQSLSFQELSLLHSSSKVISYSCCNSVVIVLTVISLFPSFVLVVLIW